MAKTLFDKIWDSHVIKDLGNDFVLLHIDRLLLHGFLHLMGYDHETDDGEMDALEGKLRKRLRLAERTP